MDAYPFRLAGGDHLGLSRDHVEADAGPFGKRALLGVVRCIVADDRFARFDVKRTSS
jgi:hypothetical protein